MDNELNDPHDRGSSGPTSGAVRGRRRFLVGAAPFALTVASRPAIASVHICTASGFQSMSPSHTVESLPDGNCGLQPSCWASAGQNTSVGFWSANYFGGSPGVTPSSSFVATFFPNSSGILGPTDGGVQLGFIVNPNITLLQALNPATTFIQYRQFKPTGGQADPIITFSATFGQQVTAALLNALAFNNGTPIVGHYPVAPSSVVSTIKAYFNTIAGKTKQELGGSAFTAGNILNQADTARNAVYQVGSAPCDA